MKKQEAIKRKAALLEEVEALNAIIEQPEMTKEHRLLQIVSTIDAIKIDNEKYPHITFLFSKGKYLFEFNSKNRYLWCRYELVWQIFEKEFDMSYSEIEAFIKGMVEEHFKIRGVTPSEVVLATSNWVEEHFKIRGGTPEQTPFKRPGQVEEHFKISGD